MPTVDFPRLPSFLKRAHPNPKADAGTKKSQGLAKLVFDFDELGNLSDSHSRPYLHLVAFYSTRRGAKDPRDRIYAFRSLSTDHDSSDSDLLPDYKAPVEEVYSRFARWCLLKNNDLAYLAHAGLPDQHERLSAGDFPSWVADWTRKQRIDFADTFAYTLKPFKAGSSLEPTISWSPNEPRLLLVKGRLVDTVSEIAATTEDLEKYSHRPRYFPFIHIYDVLLWLNIVGFNTFWRTMMRDRTLWGKERAPQALGNTFHQYFCFLGLVRDGKCWPSILPRWEFFHYPQPEKTKSKAHMPSSNQASELAMHESESRERDVVLSRFVSLRHNRFCLTAEERLGWIPDCAKPGDFDGATVPYVIRPKIVKGTGKLSFAYWYRQLFEHICLPVEADTDLEYQLVGQCYVQGLMDGEALARTDLESKFITLY